MNKSHFLFSIIYQLVHSIHNFAREYLLFRRKGDDKNNNNAKRYMSLLSDGLSVSTKNNSKTDINGRQFHLHSSAGVQFFLSQYIIE